MDQLFLVEVLVERVHFAPAFGPPPERDTVEINVAFGEVASLDIHVDDLEVTNAGPSTLEKQEMEINAGKSYLFPCNPDKLLEILENSPLILNVGSKMYPTSIGVGILPWGLKFIEMVKVAQGGLETIPPASAKQSCQLKNEEEEVMADISLFIRLMSFGTSIQTQFCVQESDESKNFLFKGAGTTFTTKRLGEGSCSDVIPGGALITSANTQEQKFQKHIYPANTITADNISKFICKCPDCPAALKFKDLGLGPLATGRGLGTIYRPTNVPLSYGMSHTYGNVHQYGPFGLYARPKSLNLPFFPKDANDCECEDDPLRLSGGSPIGSLNACEELLGRFDEVLAAYKKALEPCEEYTCSTLPQQEGAASGCGAPTCPFSRVQKYRNPTSGQAACGNPTCPVAKKKLGTATQQELMALDAVGPVCGLPVASQRLEPIHWDCPEPIPKGICRNPNCPFKPKELRYNAPTKTLPTECDNPNCPFKPADVCENPQCPFATKKPTCGNPACPAGGQPAASSPQSMCDNPSCPFNRSHAQGDANTCGSPACPHSPKASTKVSSSNACANPQCPFAKSASTCSSPQCPFAQPKSPSQCDNPSCPFASAKQGDACANPSCPFASSKQESGSTCGSPSCPHSNAAQDSAMCSDPTCPFGVGKKGSTCGEPSCPFAGSPGGDTCASPECPYSKMGDIKKECSNPDCPFRDIVCPDPDTCSFLRDNPPLTVDFTTGNVTVEYDGPARACTNSVCISDNCPNAGPSSPVFPKGKSTSALDGKGKAAATKRPGSALKRLQTKFGCNPCKFYPGTNVGHKECFIPGRAVPAKMGWLWNLYVPCLGLKARPGWRPGAVTRTVAKRIDNYRRQKGLELLAPPKRDKSKLCQNASDDSINRKPTLKIKKREGCYMITMKPLKDPKSVRVNESPFMDVSPMTFRVSKNPNAIGSDSESCACDDEDGAGSTESQLDIEITPPGGIVNTVKKKKKPPMADTDTQYAVADFQPKKGGGGKGGGKGKGKGKKK